MDTKEVHGSSSKAPVGQELVLVGQNNVDMAWPWFDNALRESGDLLSVAWTAEDLRESALDGNTQLWMVIENRVPLILVASQFYNVKNMKIFQIFWGAGVDLAPKFPLLAEAFTRFAQMNGAHRIELQGREAYKKWARQFGFELDYVVYSKTVTKVTEN